MTYYAYAEAKAALEAAREAERALDALHRVASAFYSEAVMAESHAACEGTPYRITYAQNVPAETIEADALRVIGSIERASAKAIEALERIQAIRQSEGAGQ